MRMMVLLVLIATMCAACGTGPEADPAEQSDPGSGVDSGSRECGAFWLASKRTRAASPLAMLGTVQTPTLVRNPLGEFVPVWRMATNQTVNFRIEGWEPGETIVDLRVDMLGNGSTDAQIFTTWESAMGANLTGGPGGQLSSTGTAPISPRLVGSAWTSLDLGAIAPGILPSKPPVGGVVSGAIILSGGGDTYLGDVWVTVERRRSADQRRDPPRALSVHD